MRIEIEIKDKDIVDALCTALEGGSNYWYWIETLPEFNNKIISLSENIIYYCLNDKNNIEVFDVETMDLLGYISKDSIYNGLKLFIESYYKFDPAMDANEADILFQYIVMGEVVYG